jgi:hypothetical protein
MRISFCRRSGRYVSKHHCEFFNEGSICENHNPDLCWESLKSLLNDANRPKWVVNRIKKPFQCNLMPRGNVSAAKQEPSLLPVEPHDGGGRISSRDSPASPAYEAIVRATDRIHLL